MSELLYEDEARRAMEANLPPRFHALELLEKYVDGTQYDGRADFWSDDAPMFERAPCVVYPIAQCAIRSNVDLCLGEGRWPSITTGANEDDSVFDDRFGLSETDSAALDRLIQAVSDQAKLKKISKEALESAQGCGTAVAIASARNGRLCVDTTKAKWCTVETDPHDPSIVTKLEIRYPYLQEYRDEKAKKWALRCMLYRRVIDAFSDTTYKPAKASESGDEPDQWIVDKDKTVDHGLGFCPVVWYRHMRRCDTVESCDGEAIHCRVLDEIDCLNWALSLRHRGALTASDPQPIEIGVDEDHNPAPMGRKAEVVIQGGVDPHTGKPSHTYVAPKMGSSSGEARMRGPGVVWRYPSSESRVELLTLPGDAMKPADDNARDLRSKIAESLAVVFTDVENMKAAADMSGKALREHHKRQIERCDQIRDDFGDNFLLPLVGMLLRIAMRTADGLYLPGVKKVAPILQRFEAQVEDGSVRWFAPSIRLSWGEYFQLTAADKKADIEAVLLAFDGGLITKRTALEELADYFEIGNVDEYLETIEAEAQERQEKAMETAAAMAPQAPKPVNGAAKPAPMEPKELQQ